MWLSITSPVSAFFMPATTVLPSRSVLRGHRAIACATGAAHASGAKEGVCGPDASRADTARALRTVGHGGFSGAAATVLQAESSPS